MNKRDFKILIADDDEMTIDTLSYFISEEGYNVLTAHDGFEAIRLLQGGDIQLALTDYRMPGKNGQ